MWLTADGRLHTVAVPDPRTVLSLELSTGRPLGRLPEEQLIRLQAAVEELEGRCVTEAAAIPFDAAAEAAYENEVPGHVHVVLAGSTAEEQAASLVAQVDALPIRWRLDQVMALEDLLDEVV
jgi:hypothetical protein